MVQFYFLSIFVNFIGGLLLAGDTINRQFPGFESLQEFFKNSSYMLFFAILSAVAGIFKIISVFDGDVYVVGDILPALASITISIYLFNAYFVEKKGVSEPHIEKINIFIEEYKSLLGITIIVISILHFFFPDVLFI